jgi:hypothetical protein
MARIPAADASSCLRVFSVSTSLWSARGGLEGFRELLRVEARTEGALCELTSAIEILQLMNERIMQALIFATGLSLCVHLGRISLDSSPERKVGAPCCAKRSALANRG